MDNKTISACINLAACICGKDGIISKIEEDKIFELIAIEFPQITSQSFDAIMDDFFNSNYQIETYASHLKDESLHDFVLNLAEVSASADGLDFKENIALQKLRRLWSNQVDG